MTIGRGRADGDWAKAAAILERVSAQILTGRGRTYTGGNRTNSLRAAKWLLRAALCRLLALDNDAFTTQASARAVLEPLIDVCPSMRACMCTYL